MFEVRLLICFDLATIEYLLNKQDILYTIITTSVVRLNRM